jgi:hypothetical protein
MPELDGNGPSLDLFAFAPAGVLSGKPIDAAARSGPTRRLPSGRGSERANRTTAPP